MVQCPKCKCQVGTGIAVCPYCGNQMPVETKKQTETFSNTYYTPHEPPYRKSITYHTYTPVPPTDPIYITEDRWKNRYSYQDKSYTDGRDGRSTLIVVLSVLLVCMVVANICELIALLLLIA